jgi:thioredoxin 1
MASEKVRTFGADSFAEAVASSTLPVLVDFWAEWCAPCRRIAPVVEALAAELDGRLIVGKVNVDEHPELAMRYNIRSIPTLLLFKNGQIVEQVVGAVDKSFLKQLVESHL